MLPLARKLVLAATLLCLAAVGTACKGNESKAATTGPAAANSPEIQAAKDRVAALAAPIKIDYQPGPLPSGYQGKAIAVVSNSTATGRHSSDLFATAAKKLGLVVKTFAVGNTAEDVANTMDQIVADKSIHGMIVGGIDPAAWNKQLTELQARGVPIVMYAVTYNPAWNTKSIVSIESEKSGVEQAAQDMADYVIADSNGSADTVVFNIPSKPILASVQAAFAAHYSQVCSSCKLATQDVEIGSIGKTLPGTVVSYLQGHPKTKYIVFDFGDMATGVSHAIDAAGLSGVKIVSQTPSAVTKDNIKNGKEAASLSYPLPLIGYVGVDAVARGMTNGDMSAATKWIMPAQLMTQGNVSSSTFNDDGTATPPDLESYFNQLWGLK